MGLLLNADAAEIGKFSQLAHQWWEPAGAFKALHDINPLRLEFIERVAGPLKNKAIADIGCGGGILSEALARAGGRVSAIDLSEEALAAARVHQSEQELRVYYQCCSVEAFAEERAGQFDVVCCLEMLEHVPDAASVISSCSALLKPGGFLCCSTINRNLKSYALAVIAAEYILGLLPRGTHQYNHFLKPAELDQPARESGLQLVDLQGLHYQPLTKRYFFADDVSVNYLIAWKKYAL